MGVPKRNQIIQSYSLGIHSPSLYFFLKLVTHLSIKGYDGHFQKVLTEKREKKKKKETELTLQRTYEIH